ncbi:hypothetical protein ACLKA7_011980 [Drosophila subpalustris]
MTTQRVLSLPRPRPRHPLDIHSECDPLGTQTRVGPRSRPRHPSSRLRDKGAGDSSCPTARPNANIVNAASDQQDNDNDNDNKDCEKAETLLFVLAAIVVIVVCNCHFIDDAFVSAIGSSFQRVAAPVKLGRISGHEIWQKD